MAKEKTKSTKRSDLKNSKSDMDYLRENHAKQLIKYYDSFYAPNPVLVGFFSVLIILSFPIWFPFWVIGKIIIFSDNKFSKIICGDK